MKSWAPERGVLLYRPRLAGASRRVQADEPRFPWSSLPIAGLGFTAVFAALALMAAEWAAWELAVLGLGLVLLAAAAALLAHRFRGAL